MVGGVTPEDALKLFGGGGFAGALLYLLYLVGSRMVAAIDRVASKVDAHTTADIASHADMREAIVRLDEKLETTIGWQERTPVGDPPTSPRTPPRGVPVGQYHVVKPPRGGG